jgi:hypothetical protein
MLDERKARDRKVFRWLAIAFAIIVLLLVGLCSIPTPPKTSASFDFQPLGAVPDTFTLILKPDAKTADIEAAARAHCGARSFCKVLGWIDPSRVARGMPMTDRELLGQVFNYSLNRSTGLDRAEFDCQQFPAGRLAHCMARPTRAELDAAADPRQ